MRALTPKRASEIVRVGAVALMAFQAGPLEAGFGAPPPIGPVRSCVTSDCHADVLAAKVLHTPVAEQKCVACHVLTDPQAHRFVTPTDGSQLCTLCHVQTERTVVHSPVARGDCLGCHNPHGSEHRLLLRGDPAGDLCFRCHPAAQFQDRPHVHGPVAAGACLVCHEAHSSWHGRLLTRAEDELCASCHREDVFDRLQLVRHAHPPAAEGRCTACHEPHASAYAAQLRSPPGELCLSCHAHAPLKLRLESAAHVHGAVTAEQACLACHSGHGTTLPKLLTRPVLSLCLECHSQPVTTPDGERIADMATLLRANPNHHGPIRRADCTACHNPHGASTFRLLSAAYPADFYAPFDARNYELCFTCHLNELATAERGPGVTGFRDGERNLHFVHVNNERKGRTCRACHEVHASQRPFHIREKVPFGAGGWEIEINFEALDGGGRCAPGCHDVQTYRRARPGDKP